jgi:hypothetical protein
MVVAGAAPGGADPAARGQGEAEQPSRESTTGKIDFLEGSPYDARQGFAVPYRPDCPAGAQRRGDRPPAAFEEWCELTGERTGIKHGWSAEWYPNGRPSVAGEYRDGLRVGVWTRWYPSGVKRVQAEFRDGLQHGRLIAWDEEGRKLGEQRFVDGVPAKQ